MGIAEAGQYVAVMLAPTMLVGAGLLTPRAVRALQRRVRRGDEALEVRRPPIEQLAADLRRLLQRHESLKRATDVAMRARHLQAIEAAIGDCATEAARALGVPVPDRSARNVLSTPELRRLLRALADAGLMLAPMTGLLAADGHS